ncbi:hypothetical protein ACNRBH_15080 [Ralstonia pseudosolanacearum]|uniref:hypothetical protein n=1 Tax=Ralstonia pseudosolanacearum TaxID=1310165 RepID=UPI0026754B68|nr:hypothetical protein [Ralstonia pseudosolanacearum]MDO3530081.1 hypothetical protein [Ralstonia pseudosolanacearum]
MNRLKRVPLSELQEIAKTATRERLKAFPPFPSTENLTLGTFWEGDVVVFELYIAGQLPQDAIVLTQAKVHAYTGEVVVVDVFEDAIATAARQRTP